MKSLPEVNYDIGEMYAGLVPIDTSNTSRALFSIFQPTIGAPVDEVTIWLNGGPGCSSLEGFFQENGRWLWPTGTYLPVENPFAWTNLTNMLWVEQPVGTGFSQGAKTATTQEEIAQDFIKFFKNFQQTFGIKNYKIYVTGESYAGRYVPFISAAMLNAKNKTYYDLKGALVYDPSIGSDYDQEEATAVPYVNANQNLFAFNQSFMEQLNQLDESCGYAAYRKKYLQFPPPGPQPVKHVNYNTIGACDVFDTINAAALTINPCFDIYETNSQCPLPWDVLSFPTQLAYTPDGATTYFNRTDVKKALHAPLDVNWEICTNGVLSRDTSAMSIEHVLPQVIEATNRTLISSGDLDMILITNGTLMSIQNMTWNGKLGFQSQPSTPINIPFYDLEYESVFHQNGYIGYDGPQGDMGVQHFERGLLWAQTYLCGHQQPSYQPRSAYRHMQWLLGHIEHL